LITYSTGGIVLALKLFRLFLNISS